MYATGQAFPQLRPVRFSRAELAASIAHEVNQPLAAMIANGQACLRWFDREVPDIAAARRSVQQMLDNAERAVGIVATLGAMARGRAPGGERVDLNRLVQNAVGRIAEGAEERVALVSLEMEARENWVSGGALALEQVLMNLISNAVQALGRVEGPGRIVIVSRREVAAGEAVVEVRDNGPGFGQERPERVFEPYFTTRPEGMGMGLAICRAIVTSLGGTIEARANAPRGACFTVRLPMSERAK